jgi:thiol-disulfide isomerase/thioredoxin
MNNIPHIEFININMDNIKQIKKHMSSLNKHVVIFLANWCGQCTLIKPILDRLEKSITDTDLTGLVHKIHDTDMNHLSIKMPVGFPTISLYNGIKHIQDYSGPRDVKHLLAFLTTHLKRNIIHTGGSRRQRRRHTRRLRNRRHTRRLHRRRRRQRRRQRRRRRTLKPPRNTRHTRRFRRIRKRN